MESSEGNNTSTTTATAAQPLTPENAQGSQLRTIQEAVSEGLEFSTSNHIKAEQNNGEDQVIRIINMDDEENLEIIDGALLIEEGKDDSPVASNRNVLDASAGFLDDDFYDNEFAAKATVMKMRNSNALIFFPEFDEEAFPSKQEESKSDQIQSKNDKSDKKRDKTMGDQARRTFFDKLFGLNKPPKEKVRHSTYEPLKNFSNNVMDSQLISASWDLQAHQTLNIIDNYDKVSENYEWLELLKNKTFGFFPKPVKKNSKKLKYDSPGMESLHKSIKRKVFDGMNHLNREARVASWMVLLGIDIDSKETEELRMDYIMKYMISPPPEPGSSQDKVEKQINKDCIRTFTETKQFNQPSISNQNRLFNVLKAYSYYDPELGYTQGLNFIAAMILLKVEDQTVAFVILIKLLKKDGWRRFFLGDTPKLFEVSKLIKKFINKQLPKMQKLLKKKKILLEPLIASAFITLFSNLLDIESATRVMERFMLIGEEYLIDTICECLFRNQQEILIIEDDFMIQKFLGRTMYLDSLQKGEFFLENQD